MRLPVALLCSITAAGPLCAQEMEGPPREPGAMVTLGFLIASAKPAGSSQWHQGLGGELAVLVPFGMRTRVPMAAGGFAQLQGVDGFSGPTRVGGGARLRAWLFSLDAGLAQQSADAAHTTTGFAVLAPGVQVGPGSVALRFSWPLGGGQERWPRETAFVVTLHLPLFFGGGKMGP